jgi:hypothetical protein
MEDEPTTSRGGFLRRLGILAAAGLGVAAFPEPAFAEGSCCPTDPDCDPGKTCPPGWTPHICTGCGAKPCCMCVEDAGHCQNIACPCG